VFDEKISYLRNHARIVVRRPPTLTRLSISNSFLDRFCRLGRGSKTHNSLGRLPQSEREPQYSEQTPEPLQQLVVPIALYADSLVAQVFAGLHLSGAAEMQVAFRR
jgi:hypothetical protein